MRWLVTLLVLFCASPAGAQYESGEELADMCFGRGTFEGELSEVAAGICWGFITAIGDTMISGHQIFEFRACPPSGAEGVNRGDMIDAVKAHLQSSPEVSEVPAYVVVAKALQERYPCE